MSERARPAGRSIEAIGAVQHLFAGRAAGWEERYAADQAAFDRAIAEIAPAPGASVLDLGCGTARAVPAIRRAVGGAGRVVALDATPEMLAEACRLGRAALAHLVTADAHALPCADGAFDRVFAGGLMPHLAAPAVALTEMARVVAPSGRLAIFHALGRAALAARHGGVPSDDEVLAPARLTRLLRDAGWRVDSIEDGQDRYLALARRAT